MVYKQKIAQMPRSQDFVACASATIRHVHANANSVHVCETYPGVVIIRELQYKTYMKVFKQNISKVLQSRHMHAHTQICACQ